MNVKWGLRALKREGSTAQVLFGREGKVCRWKGAPLIFSLRKFIASKVLMPGFPTSRQMGSNAAKLLENQRVYVDTALQTKRKLFFLKLLSSSLGRERRTKTSSTCTPTVGHHSLYPKMALFSMLCFMCCGSNWSKQQLVSKQHTYQTIHTERHRCA